MNKNQKTGHCPLKTFLGNFPLNMVNLHKKRDFSTEGGFNTSFEELGKLFEVDFALEKFPLMSMGAELMWQACADTARIPIGSSENFLLI
jgi:hypothetical protein